METNRPRTWKKELGGKKMSEGPPAVVPLLNNYKHGLLRRRLIQTILGGARIRKVPWHIYLIQGGLWVLPLCLSIPFTVLDGVNVWSKYLLALIYGSSVGIVVVFEGLVVYMLRRRQRTTSFSTSELDDEQDEIVLGCCGIDYINFVFSPKRLFSILLHPFLSGIFSYAGFFFLLPNVMQESLPTVGVVIVSLLGWFTVCSAHYSLSTRAPPETAVYRPTDPLELKFLNRPFYVLLIGSIFILLRSSTTVSSVYFQLLYACLCLLPLGWVVGVLPPLDALIPWILEQALVRLLGGSPMATDLRLLLTFVASAASVAIAVSLSDPTTLAWLMTIFGFLLSHDVFSNVKGFLCLLCVVRSNRIARYIYSSFDKVFTKTLISYSGLGGVRVMLNLHSYCIFVVISVLKGSVILAGSLVCVHYTSTVEDMETRKLLTTVFSGAVIALGGIVTISDSFQRPYFFGVVRNWLYPRYSGHVKHSRVHRSRLHHASLPRRIIVYFVSPLVILALVGVEVSRSDRTVPHLWQRIATARLFRATWQNTVCTLRELTVVSILMLALPADSGWISLGMPTQALIVGVALDVLKDLLEKTTFVLTSLIVFTWKRKHRTYLVLNILIIAGSIVLSPILAGMILVSSALSAPLLPLFTLPIFTVSFPRTRHFWPALVDYGSTYLKSTEETVYYQQAETEIAKAVHSSLSCGAIPAQAGTHVLGRFDNRLAVVSILEVGRGFCTVSIRGLELQETSCHTEEATQIDDMHDMQHRPKSWQQSWFNTNLLSTLSPLDSVVIKTYSDAHNVLTGIIDHPSALQRFSGNLMKTLVWVFNKHIKATTIFTVDQLNQKICSEDVHTADATNPVEEEDDLTERSPRVHRFSMVAYKEDRSKSLFTTYLGEDTLSWSSLSSTVDLPSTAAPAVRRVNNTPADSWLDASPPGLIPQDIPLEALENALPTFERNQMETILPPLPRGGKFRFTSGSIHKISPKSSEETFSQNSWQHPPLSHVQIFKLMQQFPHDWHSYLNNTVTMDSDKFELLSRTVVGCFSLLDVPAQATFAAAPPPLTYPLDICRRFCDNIPQSPHLAWMTEQPLVHKLALKAYRYAVKLMYDECCLGEADGWEELAACLDDYDQNWCIVGDSDEAWRAAVLANTPHLFSLGQDQEKNIYTAHVLSLQDEVLHMGRLNRAALEGLWADLALELVYLTNDDEERYSIQAHTHLLRNLSIQAAEPPMGYSVYASGLMTIPLT